MMNCWLILILVLFSISPTSIIESAFAQTEINITTTEPCFLNYTAGIDMWTNCGFEDDFIAAVLLPFEWVTGGIFSMIIVVILIFMTYMKYRTVIYPIAIGIIFLPISYFQFPDVFLSFALIMTGLGIAAMIYTALVIRTKDY